MKLLILMPARNEEKNISHVIENIPKNIEGINEIQCLVVDDGSIDRTADVALKAGAKVLVFERNKGVGVVFKTGVEYALENRFELLINIDSDGQFNSSEIANFLPFIILNKADMVTGNRFISGKPENMSTIKYWGNIIMSKIISFVVKEKFRDVSCGFRAFNKKAMLNLNLYGKFTYTQETFLDLKFKNLNIKEIPIKVTYFRGRKSRIADNLFKYAFNTLSIIIRSFLYYKPLAFFAFPGFFISIAGLCFVIFLVIFNIITGSYTPYKAYGFIGGGLLLFGSLMICVGFLADVLDKVRQVQEKILYFEKMREFEKNN